MDALKNLKDQEKQLVNIDDDDYQNKLLHSKEREIFRKIYNKRFDKTEELTSKIDYNNLIFTIISTGKTIDFTKNDDLLTFLNIIKKGKITIEEAKESPNDFNKHLKIVRKGYKNQELEKTLANLIMIFNGRNEAINFINGYGSVILEAKKMASEEQIEKVEQDLKY